MSFKRTLLSVLLACLLIVPSMAQGANQLFVEVSPGYSFGSGSGMLFEIYGTADSTVTYVHDSYVSLGNSGIDLMARGGYAFSDDFAFVAGAACSFGSRKFDDAYLWSTNSGAIAAKYQDSFSWSMLRLTAGVQGYYPLGSVRIMGGAGAVLGVPLSMTNSQTATTGTYSWKGTYTYKAGLGAYGEIGAEFPLSQKMTLSLSLLDTQLSLSRDKVEYVATSPSNPTVTTTTAYTDNPLTSSNNQTSGDAALTSATHKYYTYPTRMDDFSSLSIKLAIKILF